VLRQAITDADLVRLTPVQVHSLMSYATADSTGEVDYAAFAPGAARLINKLLDPTLTHKRVMVSKMAKVSPLEALTPEEKQRLLTMAETVFKQYDKDKSGKLERAEFQKCLVASKIGFSDRQIAALLAAADEDASGSIDYGEFERLFNECILAISRLDAVNKIMDEGDAELAAQAGNAVAATVHALLNDLMIPFSLAFDLVAGGETYGDGPAVASALMTKADEWGLPQQGVAGICRLLEGKRRISWAQIVALLEKVGGLAAASSPR
jgi:hypothetical protein